MLCHKKNLYLIPVLAVLAVFAFYFSCQAASYDFYVDADNDDDAEEDGTKDHPFDEIGEAVEEALSKSASSRKIYVNGGTYGENVKLGKQVGLYGESKSKVLISGTVTAGDGSVLENVSIKGKTFGVVIEAGASVVISGCDIKNSLDNGVEAQAGSGKVTIKNSNIFANRKGMYIQLGKQIEITNSNIYNNREEGADLRANVDGRIKSCDIYGNGEGGIEVVIGSSDLSISDNSIKSNGSSGIAAQFYKENKKTGQVKIDGNKITKNHKYGVSCGSPGGDNTPKGYWKDSLELLKNTIDNNKLSEIEKRCKLIEAVDENEQEDNVIVEPPGTQEEQESEDLESNTEIVEDTGEVEGEEQNRIEERNTQIREQATSVNGEIKTALSAVKIEADKINETGEFKKFLFGVDKKSLAEIENQSANIRSRVELFKSLLGETSDESAKSALSLGIVSLENILARNDQFILENKNKFSLFGWTQKFLNF